MDQELASLRHKKHAIAVLQSFELAAHMASVFSGVINRKYHVFEIADMLQSSSFKGCICHSCLAERKSVGRLYHTPQCQVSNILDFGSTPVN